MLKILSLVIVVVASADGVAMAQTTRLPMPPQPDGIILAKHDKGDGEQRGRKLGHYKHGNSAGATNPTWTYPAPYYVPPWGYGSAYPPPYPAYTYPPPPYYWGY